MFKLIVVVAILNIGAGADRNWELTEQVYGTYSTLALCVATSKFLREKQPMTYVGWRCEEVTNTDLQTSPRKKNWSIKEAAKRKSRQGMSKRGMR